MPQGSLVCRLRLARDHSLDERSAHSSFGLLRRRVKGAIEEKSDAPGPVNDLPDTRHVASFSTDMINSWIIPVDNLA